MVENTNFNDGSVPAMFSNPEFGSVRIIVKENGEPLFCGKDVATCLGYSDPSNAVSVKVDDEDKTTLVICQGDSSERTSKVTFINESGLYSLILGSKLDSAKKFKRWVTSEVLPSIRKTGPSEITSCISKDSVSEITVVNFLGRDIHVLGTLENPLFIAKDVAGWIGQSDVSSMCRVLEEHDTEKVRIMAKYGTDGSMRVKEVMAITEQGLYKILWRSNKPEAQKFASKCADIIKEIRLKGSYSVPQKERMLPQSYAEALRELAATVEENEKLALENKHQAKELEENKPKVQMYNDLMRSDGLVEIAEFAKMLNMGSKTLYKNLRRMGMLTLKNIPYQRFINDESFYVKEALVVDKSGHSRINIKVLVTPKGQKLIYEHLDAAIANEMFI